ncbi:MAG: nitrous oxide reductase family maturation protein NosD [Chitinophagales bacterium]
MRILAFLVFSVFGIAVMARHAELTPNGKIRNLHQALQSVKPGDTLYIREGTYMCVNETIRCPLVIIGDGWPVLDGQLKDEVLLITASNVSLSGVVIANSRCGSIKDYAGLRVFKANQVQIENCVFQNTFFGIYLSDSKNITIKNCKSKGANFGKSDTGNGIHLWKCDSVYIANNQMQGHRDGIYFEFAKHCFIQHNSCSKNYRYGLHFMFSDNDTYLENTFAGNGTGVAVMYSKGVHMFGNRFEDNWGDAAYGLLLKDMDNGIIAGNIFRNNTVGVTMEGGNNMRFANNAFLKNGYAIKVMANCRLDTFTGNNFTGNTFDATTNGELHENIFWFNYWDKYTGYDLNADDVGDVPFHPVSLYTVLIEQMPNAVMLLRSFIVDLLNAAEKCIPSLVPVTFVDERPLMKANIIQYKKFNDDTHRKD